MKNKFKKGAASFYIVAFSTLILMIVAISFAAVIISEVERTSNDDLSQSAYDSALAGIEDAKLAYYNYTNCRTMNSEGSTSSGITDCATVVKAMDEGMEQLKNQTANPPCDMVWKMLGRNESNNGNMTESNTAQNNMQQFTTCVTMTDEVDGYSGTLSPSKGVDVIQPKFGSGSEDYSADEIDRITLKWYSSENATTYGFNYASTGSNTFPLAAGMPIAPPILSFTVLQTGPTFTMNSFNDVKNAETNRGTVYLVPSRNGGDNKIEASELVKSNDKKVQKTPHKVACGQENDDYICSVDIELPKPIGGIRNSDTFEVVLNMPYGQFETDFLMEFYCRDRENSPCYTKETQNDDGSVESRPSTATLKGVQLEVDSTGRANDLYRRVIARLKSNTDIALSVMGPLELLGGDEGDGLTKDMTVTIEHNFNDL